MSILGVNSFQGQHNIDINKSFWVKVDIKNQTECWPWTMPVNDAGYGRFVIHQNEYLAHRIAWKLTNGEIPDGKIICHKCDNKPCCNPDHLYCGTYSDNMADRLERNPTPSEILGANAKLLANEIRSIRELNNIILLNGRRKLSLRKVASMFDVSHGTIDSIWKSDKYLCKEGYYV